MTNKELENVVGGINFSSALLTSIAKAVEVVYDIAKRIGSSIVRAKNGTVCPTN